MNKFKPLVIGLAATCAAWTAAGQAGNVVHAHSFGGSGDDRGNKIALDPQGNSIVVGRYFSKQLAFGTAVLTNADQDSTKSDAFICKMNPKGEVLWAKSFGGKGDNLCLHTACDRQGNIVLIGDFENDFYAGSYLMTNNTEKGKGGDIFIIKLNPKGEVLWAKCFGGEKHDSGYDTCVMDDEGNLLYAGSFWSATMKIDDLVLTNSGKGSEVFAAKFDPNGKVLWAQTAKGFDKDAQPQSCALDPEGNFVIAGYFTNDVLEFGKDTLHLSDGPLFVAKYSTRGDHMWAKSYRGEIGTIKTDPKGNIYMGGLFCDSLAVMGNSVLSNGGECDIFVRKLTPDGEHVWAVGAGGELFDGVRNMCVDAAGNCIVTGSYMSPVMTIGDQKVHNIGNSENMFAASFSPEGKVLWASGAGGEGRNAGRSCACDKEANIYFTGSFDAATIHFGSVPLRNVGGPDIFVVKMSGK